MTRPVFTTERLTLEPVSAQDFDDLMVIWADPVFVAAITGHPLSAEDIWLRLLRDIGHWQVKGYGNWSIRLRETGAYVGSIGVFDFRRALQPPFEVPELGWGISVPFQGQGLAQEGLGPVLAWIDTVLKADRTVCMIAPDNQASVRLALRVGYKPYGDTTYKGAAVGLYERSIRTDRSSRAPPEVGSP